MRVRWIALVGLVIVMAAGLAACRDDSGGGGGSGESGDPASCEFNPPDEEFPSVDAPGVTDTQIDVGALVAATNILERPFELAVDGTEAYFCKINSEGGVYGRELVVKAVRDDQGNPAISQTEAQALIEEDNVFAILPVSTYIFGFGTNDYLGDTGVPVFGWNLSGWGEHDNLFGERGSFLCVDCPILAPTFVAEQIDAERIAVLSYAVPQSSQCAEGTETTAEHYGIDVVHRDSELPPLDLQVAQLANTINTIRDNDAQMVVTCMDLNGTATVADALRQADVDIPLYVQEGYDPRSLEDHGDVFEGSYFGVPFWPFELAEDNEGMQEFVEYMDARDKVAGEVELVGWSSAALFVQGLLDAGPNFSQQSVIDAINQIEDWDSHGIREPVDWTIAHTGIADDEEGCNAYVKVEDGEFVPVFGEPGKPFVCFPYRLTLDELPENLDDPTFRPPW